MSTGNSLAHVTNEDVKTTLNEMGTLVKKGGYIYIDTRNWDRILRTKQRYYFYQPIFKNDERINVMQVWDYNSNDTITFNLLYAFENVEIYNFIHHQLKEFSEMEWYVVVARKK
jgi:hypothetical protein